MMMNKPDISSRFDVDDIRRIRESNSLRGKFLEKQKRHKGKRNRYLQETVSPKLKNSA